MAHTFIPRKLINITKSNTGNGSPICSSIRCETAGTAILGWDDGTTTTHTMAVGDVIVGRVYFVGTASTGTFTGGLN
jgi:hypothetical protein